MTRTVIPGWLLNPVAAFTILLAAAWTFAAHGNTYLVYLYGLGLIYATATLGLHLLANDTGDISLAQGAQVALGAFVGGHAFTLIPAPFSPMVLVLAATLAGAVAGAVVSVPMLRLRGLAVAVVTLLLNAVVFHFVLRLSDFVGGSGGLRLRSEDVLPDSDIEAVGWLTVITIAVAAVIQLLRRGRFGLGLRAIRANEGLARSVGVPVEAYRIAAYTAAGACAGVAGAMWVILHHGVAPSAFTDASSLLLLTLALLGGRGSIAGPVAAAIAMGVLTGVLGEYGTVVSFLAPVALVFVLIKHPGGLNEQLHMAGVGLRALARRLAGRGADPQPTEPAVGPPARAIAPGGSLVAARPDQSGPQVLRCQDVTVAFGGLVAVDQVSVEVRGGEVLALVGPNGAGKSTLLNAMSGHVRASAGAIWLAGADVTRTWAHRRAARGVRRTFQVGGHMPAETGFDHLRLGVHVHGDEPRAERDGAAARIARELGVARRDLASPLTDLPAGTARLIEIGVALAVPGQVLLLDEPTVGLTQPERQRLAALLRALAGEWLAVVVVDHDTAFIRQVANRVVALNAGRVIAEGSPDRVFADPAFIAAYLGSSEVLV
ncbi:MAG: ABC transporter permease subunit [Actinophytocola sp.]|uniref:branched-chain amino acid ABC transporter ATP-binding protein/permease n=1 Tax=Actinophytocola sp. TaxID=1872138 RepID=UPI003D6BDF93